MAIPQYKNTTIKDSNIKAPKLNFESEFGTDEEEESAKVAGTTAYTPRQRSTNIPSAEMMFSKPPVSAEKFRTYQAKGNDGVVRNYVDERTARVAQGPLPKRQQTSSSAGNTTPRGKGKGKTGTGRGAGSGSSSDNFDWNSLPTDDLPGAESQAPITGSSRPASPKSASTENPPAKPSKKPEDMSDEEFSGFWDTVLYKRNPGGRAVRHTVKEQLKRDEAIRLTRSGFTNDKAGQEAAEKERIGTGEDSVYDPQTGEIDYEKLNRKTASVRRWDNETGSPQEKEIQQQLRRVGKAGGALSVAEAGLLATPLVKAAAPTVAKGMSTAGRAVAQGARTVASKTGQAAKTVGSKARQLYDSAVRANNAAKGISTRKPLPVSSNQPLGNANVATRMRNAKGEIPENLTEAFKKTFSKKARIPKKGLSKVQSKRFTDDTIIDELF